jgi:hypothetical protein
MQSVKLFAALALAALSGCSAMTPRERQAAELVGALAIGAVALSIEHHSDESGRRDVRTPGPELRP